MPLVDSVKVFTGEFSRIFRHIVPGVIIIGLSYASIPSCFSWENLSYDKSLYWIILLGLSIIIGNLWYVIHRLTIHNLFDWLCYRYRFGNWNNYRSWLSNHIQLNFTMKQSKDELRKFVHFRSSQVILILIASEALILFSFWHENKTIFEKYHWLFLSIGLGMFLVGLIQFWIGFNLDVDVVESKKYTAQQAKPSINRHAKSVTQHFNNPITEDNILAKDIGWYWDWLKHEGNIFTARGNFFLIAESMLFVAVATLLDTPPHTMCSLPLLTCIVGILVTLVWLYVNWKHTKTTQAILVKKMEVLSKDYKKVKEKSSKCPWCIPTHTMMGIFLPLVFLTLWVFILISQG